MCFKHRQSLPDPFGKAACGDGQSPSAQLEQVDVRAGNILAGNNSPCKSDRRVFAGASISTSRPIDSLFKMSGVARSRPALMRECSVSSLCFTVRLIIMRNDSRRGKTSGYHTSVSKRMIFVPARECLTLNTETIWAGTAANEAILLLDAAHIQDPRRNLLGIVRYHPPQGGRCRTKRRTPEYSV